MKTKNYLLILAFLFIANCVTFAQSHSSFGYKTSGWAGFSVKIPTTLEVNGGDGFYSSDGQVEVTFETVGKSVMSPLTHYQNCLYSHSNITLKVYKSNYYVISGIESGYIYYQVTKWNGSYICTAILTYPKSMKRYYNPACSVLLKSFRLY